MHPLDIPMAETGGPFRPMSPAPGLLGQIRCRLFYDHNKRVAPVVIDQPLNDGEILPIAGGFEVIHTPGHCAGQVALLWRRGRMLFAVDVGMNLMGLRDPVGFESLSDGRASQRKIASLSFDASRPWQAYWPRCVDACPEEVGRDIVYGNARSVCIRSKLYSNTINHHR